MIALVVVVAVVGVIAVFSFRDDVRRLRLEVVDLRNENNIYREGLMDVTRSAEAADHDLDEDEDEDPDDELDEEDALGLTEAATEAVKSLRDRYDEAYALLDDDEL